MPPHLIRSSAHFRRRGYLASGAPPRGSPLSPRLCPPKPRRHSSPRPPGGPPGWKQFLPVESLERVQKCPRSQVEGLPRRPLCRRRPAGPQGSRRGQVGHSLSGDSLASIPPPRRNCRRTCRSRKRRARLALLGVCRKVQLGWVWTLSPERGPASRRRNHPKPARCRKRVRWARSMPVRLRIGPRWFPCDLAGWTTHQGACPTPNPAWPRVRPARRRWHCELK
jgi:hypothetical protein